MTIKLSLSVQYATALPELPRWRVRGWVQQTLKAIANEAPEGMLAAALTVRLVDAAEGQELNRQFRERDYATNVLTFEYGLDPEGTLAGDIVLCVPVLQKEAQEQGKTLLDHAAHLTVHGVLHAIGYDHIDPVDAQEMEAIETEILKKMGIQDPYQEAPRP